MAIDYKKIILLLGIPLIPFYEILIRILPNAVIISPNSREAKLSLSLLLAVCIGLAALCRGVNIKISNKWLLAFLAFVFVGVNQAVSIPLVVNGVDSSAFWVWRPIAYILCYFLMFIGVSSLNLTENLQKHIVLAVYWTALAMTFYVFSQWLGVDQFHKVKDASIIGTLGNPNLVGNLGQPTLVSPLLGLGVIFAFGLKKWIPSVFMILFLLILNSKMAIGATAVAGAVYLVLNWRRTLPFVLAIALICGIFIVKDFDVSELSGRGFVYKELIKDWKISPIKTNGHISPVFTGKGAGSYGYLFPLNHDTTFRKAHSDPLEILWCFGLIGLIFYVMANVECLRHVILARSKYIYVFISAFILLHLVSCGTFIFQLGVYQYLGVMLFGLLSNQSLREV